MAKKDTSQPTLTFRTRPKREANERLRELILYIADVCQDDEYFGAMKLNKLLYRVDTLAFAELGEPVTGAEYMRQKLGPVPRHLLPVKEEGEGRDWVERERSFYGRPNPQKRIVPLREADLSKFTPQQVALIDRVIRENWRKSGTEMSDQTHGRVWRALGTDGTPWAYEYAFVSDAPLDEYDLARTNELAEQFDW